MLISKFNRQDLISENLKGEGAIILIYKPKRWTSFDVVKKIRTNFKVNKVGHAGTLDPNAEGLLILATGKMTKEITSFFELQKEYIGKMILGSITPSFDTETDIIESRDFSKITREQVESIFESFKGQIKQKPPIYSAVKYRGKPLYKYARKGKILELPEKLINISNLELLKFNLPEIEFKVTCSKGTYIRSLVNDIGIKLGCGAHLYELKRTRIGNFSVDDALKIDDIKVSVENAIG